jgi:hypothetical protein
MAHTATMILRASMYKWLALDAQRKDSLASVQSVRSVPRTSPWLGGVEIHAIGQDHIPDRAPVRVEDRAKECENDRFIVDDQHGGHDSPTGGVLTFPATYGA